MEPLPVIFVSHGTPTLALEDQHPWTAAMQALGRRLKKPRAIVCVSAHWQTKGGVFASSAPRPETIYDFGGFDDALYRITYPAPGDPELAAQAMDRLSAAGLHAGLDPQRGFDHGAWVPLRRLFPEATVPVIQVSLPWPAKPPELIKMGEALAPFRSEDVLLVCSGGAVHNLRRIRFEHAEAIDPWAQEFARWLDSALRSPSRRAALSAWREAPSSTAAHPSTEHLEPLLVAAGAARDDEPAQVVHDSFSHGSLSLYSVAFGKLD